MNDRNKDILHKRVLALYQQGFSCKDISRICNLSLLHIRNYLKAAGFNTQNYRKVSTCNKDKVILLIKSGYSYSQIEQLLHVSSHLIREIVADGGLIGFAPKNHSPVVLTVNISDVCSDALDALRQTYLSGKYGLGKSASLAGISDEEFLWFVFHLTEKDKQIHKQMIVDHITSLYSESVPITAIAKSMDISPAIVKKVLTRAD